MGADRNNDLKRLVQHLSGLESFNEKELTDKVRKVLKFCRASQNDRDELKDEERLGRWYQSLSKTEPDYSMIKLMEAIPELYACFKVYTEGYIKSLTYERGLSKKRRSGKWGRKITIKGDMKGIKVVADLGCGIGYSSELLKKTFPRSKVYATELVDSIQYRFCKSIAGKKFTLVDYIEEIPDVDLLFVSEYFNFFDKPVDHLQDVLRSLKPRYIIMSNSFTIESVGHFEQYSYLSKDYTESNTSRLFNDMLKRYGYKKQRTNLWNNRPAYWKLEQYTII